MDIKRYEPNYNYVKPRIQSFKFSKEERFKSNKSESSLSPKKMNNSKDYSESNNNSKKIDDLANLFDKPPSGKFSQNDASNNNLEISNDREN